MKKLLHSSARLRRVLLASLGLLLVASTVLVTPSPAYADQGPGLSCYTNAYTPYKRGSVIYGDGNMSCSGSGRYWTMTLKVTLQRHRWFGWQQVNSKTATQYTPGYLWLPVAWNCYGVGTYTYKVVSYGTYRNILTGITFYKVVTSPTYRVRC